MLRRPRGSYEIKVPMLLQQCYHLTLPWMAEGTSDDSKLGKSQQPFVECHRLLRHGGAKRPRHPDIYLDRNSELNAFGIDRKVTRVIRRQSDQRRHDPARAKSE